MDASQGQESFMVILDGSYQHGDRIGQSFLNAAQSLNASVLTKAGFMVDEGRFNVAITRAKEVFWTIGGGMTNDSWNAIGPANNLPTRYRGELDIAGHVHRFR